MEFDEDQHSILSLPQHALLQSEKATSASLSSSSSSAPHPAKNRQQWQHGSHSQGSTISPSNSNDIHFSMASPSTFSHSFSLTQGTSNLNVHSHESLPSSSSSKFYGHTNISSNIAPQSMPYSSNRSETRFTISPTNFSEGGIRSSNFPSTSANFEMNTSMLSTTNDSNNNGDNNDSNFNTNSNVSNESQHYQIPFRNNCSMNFYNNRNLTDVGNGNFANSFSHSNRNSHYFDTGGTSSSAVLSLTNYQHGSDTNTEESSNKGSKPHSSSRHQTVPNSEDVMEFTQSVFDSRSKHLNSKGQLEIHHGISSTKTTLDHETVTSPEKRPQEMNLVTEFDFSLSARDFGSVSGSSIISRTDYGQHSRSADQNLRVNQNDQSGDPSNSNQDLSHQRYPVQSSQSSDGAVSVRKMSSMHSDFSQSQNLDQNIFTTPSKPLNEHSASLTFSHKDQTNALRSSELHKFSRDYRRVHFTNEEIQQQSFHETNDSKEEKWSGRSRAHRKMARLLGQGSSFKEKSEKIQENASSSSSFSSYQNFPKKSYNIAGYGDTFQNIQKTPEDSKKYSFLDTNDREPPNNSRVISSTDKLASFVRREDETSRTINNVRDYNNLANLGASSSSSSSLALMLRETSSQAPPPNQHFFSSANGPGLDLDIQQSLAQRELELNPQFVFQVSKDLGMEENLTENVNINPELFTHHVDPHQITTTNFPFTDNLNTQYSQDISLESYLIPPDKDSSNFSKKNPYYNQRNLASETEFSIEEYMEGQVDKEFTQSYFDRTDNVPQDMTMYQKLSPEKSTTSGYTKLKERESSTTHSFKTETKQNEGNNICELQKELTKSSGKESMKGVRIPRDINRAMEILHLQETEKEEEEKRKRELEKQQNSGIQNIQHMQQHQQQPQPPTPSQQLQQQAQPPPSQQQKVQQSTTSINSSPKKTFQNKHQIESMAALTEQQLLSMPTNFIEDQSVENVNFLDQPNYCFPDQPATVSTGFCDPNISEMPQYSGFTSLYQPASTDLEDTSISNKQRDYQQQNSGYPLNQDLDYHILKRLAFSAANAKDLDTTNMPSSLQQTSSNVTPWFTGNSSIQQADSSADLNFNLGIQRLPEHLGLLNEHEDPLPSSSNKFSANSSNADEIRAAQIPNHCENLTHPDISSDQRGSCLDPDKFQHFSSSFGDGSSSLANLDIGLDKAMALDILEVSRQNLYIMMKQEQLCDAILSTSNVEVKVHQTILCSMSQYLSSMLLPSVQSLTESKPIPSSFLQSSKGKEDTYTNNTCGHNQHHLVMLIINCDNIKSSSISAFLMFIYLGKTEFSESNVLDLFVLASSLHVLTLKNLCLQFMWQTHISGDGLTIPSVQISKKNMLEMRDQACFANLGDKKLMEDKAIYAGRVPEKMDVASQTDQTTCKVGKGGQDEWVMLKKTKQKTVSPSKSKIILNTKGIVAQDINQAAFKPSKKSWLSPKRRFKSELLAQTKNDLNNLTKIKGKEVNGISDTEKDESMFSEHIIKELQQNSNTFIPTDRVVSISSRPRMIPSEKVDGSENVENTTANVKHIKTTVEIAEEAAAAKLSASSSNKSIKKGNSASSSSSSSSSVSLSTGQIDSSLKTTTDSPFFGNSVRHSQPELNSVLGKARQNNIYKQEVENYKQILDTKSSTWSNCSTVTAEKPVKKKIIHDAFNNNCSEMNSVILEIPINTSPKKLDLYNNKSQLDGKFTMGFQSEVINNVSDFPTVSEGDLNHVSCFLDSIVNKIGSETEDAELQKVIHDLDSELNRPQVTSLPPAISSNSVPLSPLPSLSSSDVSSIPLSISSSLSTCSSSTTTTTTTTAISISPVISSPSTSSSPSSILSVSRCKSTAQGFRKRLIQLAKSENLKSSLSPSSSTAAATAPAVITTQNPSDVRGIVDDEKGAVKATSPNEALQAHPLVVAESAVIPGSDKSKEMLENELGISWNTPDVIKGTAGDAANPSNGNGKGGVMQVEDYDTQFHHKIFKRKRKSKHKKMGSNKEPDNLAVPKTKTKKVSSDVEVEGNITKSRVKRNATTTTTSSTTSDTEASASTGTRSKGKKSSANESLEGGGAIRNVRPPPKKRAKMELELMKVTCDDVGRTAKEMDKNEKEAVCGPDKDDKENDKKEKQKTGSEVDDGRSVDKDSSSTGSNGREEKGEICKDSKMNVNEAQKSEVPSKVIETNKDRTEKRSQLTKSKPPLKAIKKKKCGDSSSAEISKSKISSKSKVENDTNNVKGLVSMDTNNSKESSETSTLQSSPERNTSVESQYVIELQKQFKESGLETRIFSCKLCKTHHKSALVSVKHAMTIHKLQGDEILQNLTVGHDENRHEACDICGYVTKDVTYKYMHYHKYFKHNVPLPSGLTTKKCHLCSREFQSDYQLKEHVRSHDEDFSFTCWVCGQSFKSRNNMNNHVFHKHSKQCKHSCKVCDKAFKTWTKLKIHVRIHTGDRPFTCTECNYGSTTLGNMRHHLAQKHKMAKETVEKITVKISDQKKEMTPDALEHLMDLIVSKAMPDQANIESKRKKGKSKTKKNNIVNGNNDKSSGEENINAKSRSGNKKIKLGDSTKIALRESIYKDSNKNKPLLLSKVEHGNNTRNESTESTNAAINEVSFSSSSSTRQQTSLTIISQPIMANSILIIPSGPTKNHQLSSKFVQAPASLPSSGLVVKSLSSDVDSKSVSGSTSTVIEPTQRRKDQFGQSEESTQNPVSDSSAVENSTDVTQQNSDDSLVSLPPKETDNSMANNNGNLDGSDNLHDSSIPSAVKTTSENTVLSFDSPEEEEKHRRQSLASSQIVTTMPATLVQNVNNNNSNTLAPSSSPPALSMSGSVPSHLPPTQLTQYNVESTDTSLSTSTANASMPNFIYAAGPPILLPNPVASAPAGGIAGTLSNTTDSLVTYQGYLPSFIMYPCQPNMSDTQQSFMQIQNVPGLMQIVPPAVSNQGVRIASVDTDVLQGQTNDVKDTNINTEPNQSDHQDNG